MLNDEQYQQQDMRLIPPVRRWDDWTRWIIGGLVAGLVAWGGVGSRLATLETEVKLNNERASDERITNRAAINDLVIQVNSLKDEIRTLSMKQEQANSYNRSR